MRGRVLQVVDEEVGVLIGEELVMVVRQLVLMEAIDIELTNK